MSLASRVRELMGITPVTFTPQRQMPFDFMSMAGVTYPLYGLNQTAPGQKQEDIDGSFDSFVGQAYKSNPVVFAVINTRMRVFTEARFQFRRMGGGRPGDLFGTDALKILEIPWPNGTTGDLLKRMLQDADMAGNFYGVVRGGRIHRMRPTWVSIVLDKPAEDMDAAVIGYVYHPGGRKTEGVPLTVAEVVHFAPIPDPLARYRGMSWLTPLIREIQSDAAASTVKQSFFEGGATPNLAISRPEAPSLEEFNKWVDMMEAGHSGAANAFKNFYLTAGADVKAIGVGMGSTGADIRAIQGAGETRIAAAGGVPPIIVGLSEGLAAATYSNYGQARRAFADGTLRPLWRDAAGSLASIVTEPPNSALWYDDRDIPFLREDKKDAAEITQTKAASIGLFIDKGFTRESAVKAVAAEDETLLKPDPDWVSVQVQNAIQAAAPAPTNGKTTPDMKPAEMPGGAK